MTDQKIKSWIFLATASASCHKPANLKAIIGAADGINKLIPKEEELQTSLRWLINQGFIAKEAELYHLTAKGILQNKAASENTKNIFEKWENLNNLMMVKNTILPFILGFAFLIFQNCSNKKEEIPEQSKVVIEKSDTIITAKIPKKNAEYSIRVEKIDSVDYYSVKRKIKIKPESKVKITDFKEAKKLLKGIVEFVENKDSDEYHMIKKINLRNGTVSKSGNLLDCSFVAYFPEEDILLCEGGHSSEVSFNLSNGKEAEDIGNPDFIKTSPQKEWRLNGFFGGQECASYFIQKKINNEFVKVIQLDEAFEKLTKIWLCTVGESFWSDEKNLYLTETDFVEKGISTQYFKIDIIEK